MTGDMVFRLVLGVLLLAAGVVIVRFRRPLHKHIVDQQRMLFGSLVDRVNSATGPNALLFPAVGAFFIGGAHIIVVLTSIHW